MTATAHREHLELRVRELAQLFNSMDPTPFHSRDLDREAEVFIESWARQLPSHSSAYLTVHLTELPDTGNPGALVSEAIHHHFAYKARLVRQQLSDLFRQGRTSMLIGIAFVTVCLLIAELIAQPGAGPARSIARESLTIVGWVAMWRPLNIFLYDWWPLRRRIAVYRMLSRAHVRVVQGE